MARFSASGDEDGRDERRHASKKPRTSAADSGESPFRFPCARRRVPIDLYEDSEMESDRLSPVEEPDEDEDENEEGEEEDEEEEEEVQDQQSRDSPAPVTVTLTDPDVFAPSVLSLSALRFISDYLRRGRVAKLKKTNEPCIYFFVKCENGHISCPSCCIKMKNKCGTCSRPIGYSWCRAIEKVLESVKIACKNKQHGCGETINYSKKHDHEKTCIYAPCDCPYLSCTHVSISNSLYTHFATVHSRACKKFLFNTEFSITVETSQQNLFLQEKNENILFVLDHTNDYLGSLISVVCVAPTSSKRSFLYDIYAKDGMSLIRVRTVAENMPKWVAQPRAKKLFLMPKDFIASIRLIKIELMIQSLAK